MHNIHIQSALLLTIASAPCLLLGDPVSYVYTYLLTLILMTMHCVFAKHPAQLRHTAMRMAAVGIKHGRRPPLHPSGVINLWPLYLRAHLLGVAIVASMLHSVWSLIYMIASAM